MMEMVSFMDPPAEAGAVEMDICVNIQPIIRVPSKITLINFPIKLIVGAMSGARVRIIRFFQPPVTFC